MVLYEGRHFVLMAEDDPDDRLLYEEAMAKSRFNVVYHISPTGPDLIKFLRTKENPRPAIVLVDLRLPGMDAHEIIAAIKAEPKLEMIPVVVLTGSDEDHEIRRIYAEGAKGYVIKPSAFEELVEKLNEIFTYWFSTVRLPT